MVCQGLTTRTGFGMVLRRVTIASLSKRRLADGMTTRPPSSLWIRTASRWRPGRVRRYIQIVESSRLNCWAISAFISGASPFSRASGSQDPTARSVSGIRFQSLLSFQQFSELLEVSGIDHILWRQPAPTRLIDAVANEVEVGDTVGIGGNGQLESHILCHLCVTIR